MRTSLEGEGAFPKFRTGGWVLGTSRNAWPPRRLHQRFRCGKSPALLREQDPYHITEAEAYTNAALVWTAPKLVGFLTPPSCRAARIEQAKQNRRRRAPWRQARVANKRLLAASSPRALPDAPGDSKFVPSWQPPLLQPVTLHPYPSTMPQVALRITRLACRSFTESRLKLPHLLAPRCRPNPPPTLKLIIVLTVLTVTLRIPPPPQPQLTLLHNAGAWGPLGGEEGLNTAAHIANGNIPQPGDYMAPPAPPSMPSSADEEMADANADVQPQPLPLSRPPTSAPPPAPPQGGA
uniref:Uncharacterized protein n=1 Tax=Chromera velia CCMP2878 TaxID=1169474 RepID=A0A0G4FCC6_9ALVE|eukprot:Cvel_16311.t1-p1 / transcript=Cvel_16311.t1 / gene=Cvel_16311 / organism=Chromera_velia_CCMP2878 / gene_product=hypothetical protein / transcript_product=hypothetical protein / location=Cvel_scaffold1251:44613-45488(-) / protein_length=292 / sequence_SO=supercontig / SO=protein_coding / is_pseudo=false